MSAICRRSWRSMSAISTTGARIVPSDNARPARPRHGLIEVLKLEGSPRYLYSEASITFISKPHYDASVRILAPYSRCATTVWLGWFSRHNKPRDQALLRDRQSAARWAAA